MLSIEDSDDPGLRGVINGRFRRGGWLCDEVGMGKTACITSLVLAAPSKSRRPTDKQFQGMLDSSYDGKPVRYKVTLVIVNNTLVQQWADEVKKFAPGLVVRTYYASKALKDSALKGLRDADVLITTPHMVMPTALKRNVVFHRIVVDEAHLLGDGSTTTCKLPALCEYKRPRVWLVTGTPFSTSLEQLENQAKLLGFVSQKTGYCHTRNDHAVFAKEWDSAKKPAARAPVKGGASSSSSPPDGARHTRHTSSLVLHEITKGGVASKYVHGHGMVSLTNAEICRRLRLVMIRHVKVRRRHAPALVTAPPVTLTVHVRVCPRAACSRCASGGRWRSRCLRLNAPQSGSRCPTTRSFSTRCTAAPTDTGSRWMTSRAFRRVHTSMTNMSSVG